VSGGEWREPGPRQIPSGSAPGGVVVYGYAVPSERLIFVQAIPQGHAAECAERIADANFDYWLANALPGDEGVCLVAYDGDSGERMAWR
jgi:hypothetical protein